MVAIINKAECQHNKLPHPPLPVLEPEVDLVDVHSHPRQEEAPQQTPHHTQTTPTTGMTTPTTITAATTTTTTFGSLRNGLQLPLLCRSHLSVSASKLHSLKQKVQTALRRPGMMTTRSYDEGLDSFYVVDESELVGFPDTGHTLPGLTTPSPSAKNQLIMSNSFDSALHQYRRHSRGRSWTTPTTSVCQDSSVPSSLESSLSSTHSFPTSDLSPSSPHPSPGTAPTYKWVLKRNDFIGPIFKHNNKTMDRKFRVRAGSKEDGCGFTFLLKLYPNGINWALDSYMSLKVEVPTPSSHPSTTLYFSVTVVEEGSSPRVLACRRRVCKLKEEKAFLLEEFLSHDVVKASKASHFHMLFDIDLCYRLGEDWVSVGTEHGNLGCFGDHDNSTNIAR